MSNSTSRQPGSSPVPARTLLQRLGRWLGPGCLLISTGLALYFGIVAYRAHQHRQAAAAALEQRDFQQANESLAAYLELRPRDTEVRLLAAQTRRRSGDPDGAVREQRRYLAAGGAEGPLQLENRLLHLQQSYLSEATALLAEHPHDPLVLEAYLIGTIDAAAPPAATGASFIEKPPPAEAPRMLQMAQRWLALQSGHADQVQGLIWRGRIHALLGDYAATVADYRRALELAPDHYEARKFLAYALGDRAPDEMVTHLRTLHQRRPDDVYVAFSLAVVAHSLGHLPEARQLLDALLVSQPNDASILLARGQVALDEGELASSEQFLMRALERNPTNPTLHHTLSRCLQARGRPAEAREHQNRYLQLQQAQKKKE